MKVPVKSDANIGNTSIILAALRRDGEGLCNGANGGANAFTSCSGAPSALERFVRLSSFAGLPLQRIILAAVARPGIECVDHGS
jgi:hypothetical protein